MLIRARLSATFWNNNCTTFVWFLSFLSFVSWRTLLSFWSCTLFNFFIFFSWIYSLCGWFLNWCFNGRVFIFFCIYWNWISNDYRLRLNSSCFILGRFLNYWSNYCIFLFINFFFWMFFMFFQILNLASLEKIPIN